MSTLLPFDHATIGATELPPAVVLPGSGSYQERGRDIATTTADGRIHHDRQAVLRRAALEVRGDFTSLDTPPGVTESIVLRRGLTIIASFTGLVTATWHARSRTTSLTLHGDPLTE